MASNDRQARGEAANPAGLSEREAEVLQAVGSHLTNAQIAGRLHISVRTVESHVSSLLRKLGVPDRRALAGMAYGAAALPAGSLVGLPSARTSFVGRDAEQAAVLAALTGSRLVTLTGPGGVGKTRLAAQAAGQAAAAGWTSVIFADLVPVREEFVVQAVATLIGVSERPGRSLDVALYELLTRGRPLLVLDNCEHLLGVVAEFTEKLLANCDGLTVLATSRERLAVAGERTVPVPPLPVTTRSDRTGSDAAALFTDRALACDPEFTAAPEVIGEVCARLDGVPLAIELAAARFGSLGADGLLAGLDDHLRLLAGSRGAQQRHRSLRSVIDWSHDLLDEAERSAFRRAGVFAGGFDLAAAAAVCTGGDRGLAADLIGRLTDKSLLVHWRGPDGSRWQMLKTIRAYALDRLAASGEDAGVRTAHLAWAAAVADGLEQRAAAGQPWLDGFDAVADDLRAALAGTPAAPGPADAPPAGEGPGGEVSHRLARALGHLAYAHRFMAEAHEHYLAAAARTADGRQAAADLRAAADVAWASGQTPRAYDLLVKSAGRAWAAGDPAAQAIALACAATIADRFAEDFFPDQVPHEELREWVSEAAEVCPPGDDVAAAWVAVADAWTRTAEKTVPDPDCAEAALALAQKAGDPVLLSGAYDAVVVGLDSTGQIQEAYRVSQQRAGLLNRLPRHDPRAGAEIADILHMVTAIAVTAGDLPNAASFARREQLDDIVSGQRHFAVSKLIQPLVLQGEFGEALRQGAVMWEAWQRAGRRPARGLLPAAYGLVLASGLCGDGDGHRSWLDRVHELAGPGPHPAKGTNLESVAAFTRARIALHYGRTGEALDAVAAVADLQPEKQDWYGTPSWHTLRPYAWAIAAEVAVAAGLPDAAARLAAAAPAGEENYWAAACLARASGQLHGDPSELETALAGWERIGARFERACTLTLLPTRAAEGRAELTALGCPPPATPAD